MPAIVQENAAENDPVNQEENELSVQPELKQADDTPSTMSYKVTTEILRNDLSYTGIIITDALNMGAITEKRLDESLRRIIKAKLLLMD